MKAITLWQPWASLLALGYKTVETRSWPTNHRGPLAIHAAGRPCDPHIFYQYPFQRVFLLPEVGIAHPSELPLGAVLAIVDLADVKPSKELAPPGGLPRVGWLQLAFGDFTPGRFAWMLKDRRPLEVPIGARGKQGLWDWDPPPGFELPDVQAAPGPSPHSPKPKGMWLYNLEAMQGEQGVEAAMRRYLREQGYDVAGEYRD